MSKGLFIALLVGLFLFVPIHCSTYHVGDYGPRTTEATASVNQMGILLAAIAIALLVLLRSAALILQLRALLTVRHLEQTAELEDEAIQAKMMHWELSSGVPQAIFLLLVAVLADALVIGGLFPGAPLQE
jgi:hypothetical protein